MRFHKVESAVVVDYHRHSGQCHGMEIASKRCTSRRIKHWKELGRLQNSASWTCSKSSRRFRSFRDYTSRNLVNHLEKIVKHETVTTACSRLQGLSSNFKICRNSCSSVFCHSSPRLSSSSTSWRRFVRNCSSRSLLCALASASNRAQVILCKAPRRISTSVTSGALGLRGIAAASLGR